MLVFTECRIVERNSFLNYIFGGCEINLAVAIDFTLSNGDPQTYNSLHCNQLHRNQYFQALKLRGVETAMVRVPDAGHGIGRRPSHLLSKVAHILAWFER